MNAEIPRYLEGAIRAHLHKKEITLLIGPRQAGKTTLLRKIAVELQSKGEKCLFFNLDIDTDAQFFGTQQQFLDPGLQHFLTNTHTVTPASPAFGFLFQQMVLQLLKLRHADTIADIRYWRTQNQAEVDFVVYDGRHPLPVEVKSVPMAQPQIERSMRSFIADYNPPIAWIVNRSLGKVVQIDSTQVHFIPWYRLLGT